MRKIFGGAAITVLAGALLVTLAVRAQEKSAAKGPNEDGTKAALVKIAGQGMLDSHAFQYLTELSDDVGARVTGSPRAQKGIEWGLAKMRAMGLENVHAEKWQLWRGWTRGTAQAELLTPIRRPLHVDAMGWTGSTPAGGVDGEVVTVNIFDLDKRNEKHVEIQREGCAGGDARRAEQEFRAVVRRSSAIFSGPQAKRGPSR